MKPFAIAGVVLSLASFSHVLAADLAKLRVLYVGEPANSARASQITGFVGKHVARLGALARKGFTAEQAAAYDVVLFDWPQSDKTEQERQQGSPVGPRNAWNKPTVLLGSAGLNMAVVWKVRGGSG